VNVSENDYHAVTKHKCTHTHTQNSFCSLSSCQRE